MRQCGISPAFVFDHKRRSEIPIATAASLGLNPSRFAVVNRSGVSLITTPLPLFCDVMLLQTLRDIFPAKTDSAIRQSDVRQRAAFGESFRRSGAKTQSAVDFAAVQETLAHDYCSWN
jgi:hypothetical protein